MILSILYVHNTQSSFERDRAVGQRYSEALWHVLKIEIHFNQIYQKHIAPTFEIEAMIIS